jgi:hypothetical protein
MDMRQRIEEKIRKKESEVQEFENQIRDAKIYIEALKETIKMLPRDTVEVRRPEAKLRQGSRIARVYALLVKMQKPMHVSALLEGIGEENTKENRVGLSGSLGFYTRDNQIFTRPSPNTFGLVDFGGSSLIQSSHSQPPDNFGLFGGESEEKEKDSVVPPRMSAAR